GCRSAARRAYVRYDPDDQGHDRDQGSAQAPPGQRGNVVWRSPTTFPRSASGGVPPRAGRNRSDEAEVGDGVALADQLGDRRVDPGAGELADLQALDDLPAPTRRAHREGGDDAFRNAVGAVRR